MLPTPLSTAARPSVWSDHWHTGALHSCAGDSPDGLGGGFVAFWRPLVESLPPNAQVLEVGAGNGVLPYSALKWRDPFDLDFRAVDWASVRPEWWNRLDGSLQQRITIQGGVRMESLPFETARFDAVFSQYALEYGTRPDCVMELKRVARPGAQVALVCHHRESRPVRLAQAERALLATLLEPQHGLLAAAAQLVPWLSLVATAEGRARLQQSAEANAARQGFNAAQDRLSAAMASSDCPDVGHEARDRVGVALDLATQGRLDNANDHLTQFVAALRGSELRLVELQACALDEHGAHQLIAPLQFAESSGWQPLVDQGHLMAWCFRGRLAA